jgi:tetratricopeptide (TPR) repeat protein
MYRNLEFRAGVFFSKFISMNFDSTNERISSEENFPLDCPYEYIIDNIKNGEKPQFKELFTNTYFKRDKKSLRENTDVEFDPLLESLNDTKRRKTRTRGRPKNVELGFGRSTTHKLSSEASILMGKANSSFVSHDFPKAIEYLYEVIKISNESPEPYKTLGLIYEELQEFEKSLGLFMVAVHLDPQDSDTLLKIVNISLGQGRMREAVYFLNKAIISLGNSASFELFTKLSSIHISLGDSRKGIFCFYRYLMKAANSDEYNIDEVAFQNIAQLSIDCNSVDTAISLFERIIDYLIKKKSLEASWSPINLLFELLIIQKNYGRIIELLNVYLDSHGLISLSQDLFSSSIIDKLQPIPEDIYCKYAISKIYTGQTSDINFQRLNSLDPSLFGDLRVSLASALIDNSLYTSAIQLLLHLPDNYFNSETLYKLGLCYQHTNEIQHAIDIYSGILAKDPSKESVRISLADLFQQLGRKKEALDLMEANPLVKDVPKESHTALEDSESESLDIHDEIYDPEGGLLNFETSRRVQKLTQKTYRRKRKEKIEYSPEECSETSNCFRRFLILKPEKDNKLSADLQKEFLKISFILWNVAINNGLIFPPNSKSKLLDDPRYLSGLSVKEWGDFFIQHIFGLENLGHTDAALKAAKTSLKSSIGKIQPLCKYLRYSILYLHYKNQDFKSLADCLRFIWSEESTDQVPYFYSLICPNPIEGVKALSSINFFRFISRTSRKKPNFLELGSLRGHLFTLSGSFEEAQKSFRGLYAFVSTEAEECSVDFFLFNSLFHRSMQRTCQRQKETLLESFSYLFRYLHTVETKFIEKLPQAYYNVGRAYHSLGIYGVAEFYYSKSLSKDPDFLPSKYNSSLIKFLHH